MVISRVSKLGQENARHDSMVASTSLNPTYTNKIHVTSGTSFIGIGNKHGRTGTRLIVAAARSKRMHGFYLSTLTST